MYYLPLTIFIHLIPLSFYRLVCFPGILVTIFLNTYRLHNGSSTKRRLLSLLEEGLYGGAKNNINDYCLQVFTMKGDIMIPSVYLWHKHRQLELAALNINYSSYNLLSITNSYNLVLQLSEMYKRMGHFVELIKFISFPFLLLLIYIYKKSIIIKLY